MDNSGEYKHIPNHGAPAATPSALIAAQQANSSDKMRRTGPNPPKEDLASLFECPVCFDYVLPPIIQVRTLLFLIERCALCHSVLFLTQHCAAHYHPRDVRPTFSNFEFFDAVFGKK